MDIVRHVFLFDPISVVIAGEEAVSLELLRKVLAQPGIDIVGEANDADGAALITGQMAPQVLIVDYSLCRKLHKRGDGSSGQKLIRTIVMLAAPEKSHIVEVFRLGAQGVVLKGSDGLTWRDSLRSVAAGQYWVGEESLAVLIQAVCEHPESRSLSTAAAKSYGLTPREIEVIRKIAEGCSNKEVGRDFSIRERTVKRHLTHIFDKVGVSSRLELALFARNQKIGRHASPQVSGDVAEKDV